jgi:hypothetical protein
MVKAWRSFLLEMVKGHAIFAGRFALLLMMLLKNRGGGAVRLCSVLQAVEPDR